MERHAGKKVMNPQWQPLELLRRDLCERDPHKLAELRDPRVKANQEQIARHLEGNWQQDLLFVLKQEHEAYEFCQKQMAACDDQLQQYLQQRPDRSQGASLPEEKRKGRLKKRKRNAPQFNLRAELFRMTGTDLTQVDRIDVMVARAMDTLTPMHVDE